MAKKKEANTDSHGQTRTHTKTACGESSSNVLVRDCPCLSLSSSYTWRCRNRTLRLSNKTLIMGILNVTPDSFSDGGRYVDIDMAVEHAVEMVEQGADIIDIGGESTRPGAEAVPADEESKRVVPVIEALHARCDCLISIDTTKASVARAAMESGAHIINDISAMRFDESMPSVVTDYQAGVVIMHIQGTPQTMQNQPHYVDVIHDIRRFLDERVDTLQAAGITPEHIVLDPGIGFGKTVEHNLDILRHMEAIRCHGRPMLIGLSRKSFLGEITGCEVGDRLSASLSAGAYAILRGAQILRVHDVKESCEMARIVDILHRNERRVTSTQSN